MNGIKARQGKRRSSTHLFSGRSCVRALCCWWTGGRDRTGQDRTHTACAFSWDQVGSVDVDTTGDEEGFWWAARGLGVAGLELGLGLVRFKVGSG